MGKNLIVTPGQILNDGFLKPRGITPRRLALNTGMQLTSILDIIHGIRPIDYTIAVRLGQFLETSSALWILLQTHYTENKIHNRRTRHKN